MVRRDRFFLRPTRQLPRKLIHGDSAEMTHRADFSPAPVCLLVRVYGHSARAKIPLNWLANVAFRPPVRVSPRGKTQCRCCRHAPFAQCPLRCLFPPNPMGPTLAEQQRSRLFRDTVVAQLQCDARSPLRQNGHTPPRPDRRRFAREGAASRSSEVRKFRSIPDGQ